MPASTDVRGATSPTVDSQRRVTFTLKAPDAQSLAVAGGDGLGKGPFPMARGSDGVWSVTTAPAVPGFHYYWFILNGVAVNDPGSETFFGYGKETSGVEVPAADADFYALKPVPHGEVRAHWYASSVTGSWRRVLVYTPPGYDTHVFKRYPLLILQHGAGENETSWTRQGRAQFILDNLIASARAVPMIVAMDNGYADLPGKIAPQGAAAFSPQNIRTAFGSFEDVLIRDLIPALDRSYRTRTDRNHRAIAGLSMGGMESLFAGLHHLDSFAYIGSFSGPFIPGINTGPAGFDPKRAYEGVFGDPAAFNRRVKLLWLGAGTEEEFRAGIADAAHALESSGVHVVYFESPGTAHEWQTWRRDLLDFAPRLFR